MVELAGVMVGNYFLLERLGSEGMVEAYRARPTTRGGYDVVLRLFRPQFPDPTAFQEHFAAEIEKVWRCHHEHIQPLVEFGAGDGLLFSVTRLIEAETLEQFLKRTEGQLAPVPAVVALIDQLCSALQYAHEYGIVHGNIQPSSILLQEGGHVLLTNFSMKRIYQEGEPVVAQIEEGNAAYTAPEQVVGMVTPASDIYSLGVLLFCLLTGRLPYEGESEGRLLSNIPMNLSHLCATCGRIYPRLWNWSFEWHWRKLHRHVSQALPPWQRLYMPLSHPIVRRLFLFSPNAAYSYVLAALLSPGRVCSLC